MEIKPYPPLRELSWSTWKSVILLSSSKLADKIEEAYFHIPAANNYLRRTEEFKWGLSAAVANLRAAQRDNLEEAKHYISETLLPQLKEAQEFLEKASREGKLAWLKKRFWC